jgi:hypothetical protein
MTTSKLVTGRIYERGIPRIVTGWLMQHSNLNGKGADALVPVTLLTEDGERFRNVLTRVVDVLGIKVRTFTNFTDHMLWRVAEIDMGGLGERALAELAYRERLALKEKVREQSARLEGSKRAADMLTGRV